MAAAAPSMTRKDYYLSQLREAKETLYQGAIRHDKRTALLCAITVLAVVGVLLGVYQPNCQSFFLTSAGKSTLIGLSVVGASSLLWIFWPAVNGEPFKSQLRLDVIKHLLDHQYTFETVVYYKGERGEKWTKRTPTTIDMGPFGLAEGTNVDSKFAPYKSYEATKFAKVKDFLKTPFVRNRVILFVAMAVLATLGALLGTYHAPFQNFFLSYAGKWVIGGLTCVAGASLLWIVWPLITYKQSKHSPKLLDLLEKKLKMKFHKIAFANELFGEYWKLSKVITSSNGKKKIDSVFVPYQQKNLINQN